MAIGVDGGEVCEGGEGRREERGKKKEERRKRKEDACEESAHEEESNACKIVFEGEEKEVVSVA